MHSYEFVNTNNRDIPSRQEDDPNRRRYSSPEEGEKNSKVCTTTVDADNQRNSKTQSGKELIEKDESSRKSEIDLSRASPKTDLDGDKGKPNQREKKKRF